MPTRRRGHQTNPPQNDFVAKNGTARLAVFGMTLEEAEQRWLEFLGG